MKLLTASEVKRSAVANPVPRMVCQLQPAALPAARLVWVEGQQVEQPTLAQVEVAVWWVIWVVPGVPALAGSGRAALTIRRPEPSHRRGAW
jgi:hypothetical protein